jgi:hypothetical protein
MLKLKFVSIFCDYRLSKEAFKNDPEEKKRDTLLYFFRYSHGTFIDYGVSSLDLMFKSEFEGLEDIEFTIELNMHKVGTMLFKEKWPYFLEMLLYPVSPKE